MQVSKISKAPPLRVQAYEQLKSSVVGGRIKPGDRLTEERAASFLGVSRTPAREALALLVQEGILDRRAQGGYVVPMPSLDKVTRITEVRKLLEPHATRLTAERATSADIQNPRAAIDAEWAVLEEMTPGVFLTANRAVRDLLYDLSGNDQLVDCIGRYTDHLQFIGTQTLGDIEVRRIAVSGHDRIYRAIASHDAAAAAAATERQIDAAQAAAEAALTDEDSA